VIKKTILKEILKIHKASYKYILKLEFNLIQPYETGLLDLTQPCKINF
jgi:hypothetical protein